MKALWIRIDAHAIDSKLIASIADALNVDVVTALGHYVAIGGAVAEHAPDGRIVDAPDSALERWANWSGKRGKFAAAVRPLLQDASGEFLGWRDSMGKLVEQRERDRTRKGKGTSDETRWNGDGYSAEIRRDSGATVRNGTVRNGTDTTSSSSAHDPSVVELESAIAARLASDADRAAFAAVVARARSRGACIAALDAVLSGNDPAIPAPDAACFGEALRDYAANGDVWNAAHFRGYLKRAVAGDRLPFPARRGGVAQRTYENGRKALEGL